MKKLVWFRRDLRLYDNPALYHACDSANEGVIGVFFITEDIWEKHHNAPCQIDFLLQNLEKLSLSLQKHKIPLLIKRANSTAETEKQLKGLIKKHHIDAIYLNELYEHDEKKQDAKLKKRLSGIVDFNVFNEQTLIHPSSLQNKQGRPFLVYTPFKNKLLEMLCPDVTTPLPAPSVQKKIMLKPDPVPKKISFSMHKKTVHGCKPGEIAALNQLDFFLTEKIISYKKTRDFPSFDGTSGLSPYLALGVLSARQCLQALLSAQKKLKLTQVKAEGAKIWVQEILWREFYRHILYHFPRVCQNKPFKQETGRIKWRKDAAALTAWKTGQTGCPIVDAAMRQLMQTGWMHNRLRMITAMFLTKNLLIDWRLGEQHFMENLIDGDFASNNGGWQWSASTGTDSAPYFRIFNPVLQSQRFDPEGVFIRQYCPEISSLDKASIHLPDNPAALAYPELIVDLKISRQRAIDAFKKIKKPA